MPNTSPPTIVATRSPVPRKRSRCGVGWMNRIAKTSPTPRAYQAIRRRNDGMLPSRAASSYSAAPKRSASSRSITSRRASPMTIRWRSGSGMSGISAVAHPKHRQERVLGDLYGPDTLHPLLAFLLLLEQLSLAGDVATVALGDHV